MNVSEDIPENFDRDGVAVIRGFYDVDRMVKPIQDGIRDIIEVVARRNGLSVPCAGALEAMTRGYPAIIKHDRKLGGVIYDAVKQIPEFVALVSATRNKEIYQMLHPGSIPGIAAAGYGIRIDNPDEDRFRAFWHQEFPAQLRSIDGLVLWSPLLPVTPEMGPVEVAVGSHREGLVPVLVDNGDAGKTGAYSLRLENEAERIARYEKIAPLTEPGDLIIMDFLTLHQSGRNVSDHPRWSMQFRYFNFADPVGASLNWSGAFAQGKSIDEIFKDIRQVLESAAA
jgi:hypothetical protein